MIRIFATETARRWHRALTVVGLVLLGYAALTGMALSLVPPPRPVQRIDPLALARRAIAAGTDLAPGRLRDIDLVLVLQAGGGRADIGISGAAQRVSDSIDQPGPPPPGAARQVLRALHRGAVLGLPGEVLNLLSAVAAIFFVVSGAALYADRLPRPAPGWLALDLPPTGRARRAHRWLAAAAALPMLYAALTGAMVQSVSLVTPPRRSIPAPRPPGTAFAPIGSQAGFLPDDAPALALRAVQAGLAAAGPDMLSLRMQLHLEGQVPQADLELDSPARRVALQLDALTGQAIGPAVVTPFAQPPSEPKLRARLAAWHAISALGPNGCWVDFAIGLVISAALLSGIAIPLGQRRRRRSALRRAG